MKKSNKLTAAGVGLLIAAAASMGPAFASEDPVTEPVESATEAQVAGVDQGVAQDAQSASEAGDNSGEEVPLENRVGGVATEQKSSDATEDAESASPVAEENEAESDAADTNTAGEAENDSDEAADTETTDVEAQETENPADSLKKTAEDTTAVVPQSDTATKDEQAKTAPASETAAADLDSKSAAKSEATKSVEPIPATEVATEKTEGSVGGVIESEKPQVEEVKPEVTSPEPTTTVLPDATAEKAEEAPAEQVSPLPLKVEETKKAEPATPVEVEVSEDSDVKNPVSEEPSLKLEIPEPSSVKAQAPVAEQAPAAPVRVVDVKYVQVPSSLATSRSTNTVGKSAKPQTLGPVLPLIEAVSEAPTTQGTVNLQSEPVGAQTENGQSMVVWFELPPAEGPALKPGQSTTPLLGSAVTETAVSSNVIPASQVAPQQTPSGTTATASAAVPVANATATERGVMARSLARTGSLAQYAALLSAVAMVVGVGMLVGAAVSRRKQD